jgi:hypothetical protein
MSMVYVACETKVRTFVEITKSLRFHPKCLMAFPMTISELPSAYPSAQSKKLIPQSYAAFMHAKVPSAFSSEKRSRDASAQLTVIDVAARREPTAQGDGRDL